MLSQTVNQDAATTKVTSSANPSVYGESVTFTATVTAASPGSGTPSGTVTFLDSGSPIGMGSLSSGKATFSTTFLVLDTHTITVSYGGDANFTGTTSAALSQTVNQAASTSKVTSSANPAVYGQTVTFTATVKPVAPATGTPTGIITFLDGGSPIGTGTLSGGTVTFSTAFTVLGAIR